MQNTDGRYNRRPWDSIPEQRLTATLGALAGASAEQISALRPPLPNTQLFPDRFGFEQRAITVEDCFALGHKYATALDDYTRVQPGYSSSPVHSLGQN